MMGVGGREFINMIVEGLPILPLAATAHNSHKVIFSIEEGAFDLAKVMENEVM